MQLADLYNQATRRNKMDSRPQTYIQPEPPLAGSVEYL
jgi:hypothetical protein